MSAVWNRFAALCTKLMSANRKRLCVYYLTYLESGGKQVFCYRFVSFVLLLGWWWTFSDTQGHLRTGRNNLSFSLIYLHQ